MEFWIGLSVGMHLGRVLAGYLEKFGVATGLLNPEAAEDIAEIEKAAGEISQIVDAATDD